jgi:hypothetical protein
VRKIKKCQFCGKLFERNYSISNKKHKINPGKFCSSKCSFKGQNAFKEKKFKFDLKKYKFFKPLSSLGSYKPINKKYLINKKSKSYDFLLKKGIHNEATAYFFGLAITDGWLIERSFKNPKPPYFGLELKDIDKDIIYKLAKALTFKDKIYVSKKATYKLYLRGEYIANDLIALGCSKRKSYIANYPLIKKKSLHKHLIRGLIDGDGSFYLHAKKYLRLKICGNDKLVYGFYLIIKKFLNVGPATLEYPENRIDLKMKTFCALVYGADEAKIIRDWIYKTKSNLYSLRKYKNSLKEPDNDTYFNEHTPKTISRLINISANGVIRIIKRYNLPIKKYGKVYTIEKKNLKKFYETCFNHFAKNNNEGSLPKLRKLGLLKTLKSKIKSTNY